MIPSYVATVAKTRDITVGSIVPSALGGVAAALVLSYFGAAGSLVGAALGPVVFLVVKELSRGPTEAAIERAVRVPPRTADARARRDRRPSGSDGRPRPRGGLRWLVATAVLATAIAVSVITIPELITGSSLTTDRQTTFFDRGSGGASEPSTPAAGTTTAPGETTAPASTEATTTTEPAPEATTTTPPEGASTAPPPAAPPPAATEPVEPVPAAPAAARRRRPRPSDGPATTPPGPRRLSSPPGR